MACKHSSLNLFAALQVELSCRLLWIARKHYSHYHTVAFRLDSCHLKHQHVLDGRKTSPQHIFGEESDSTSLSRGLNSRDVKTLTARDFSFYAAQQARWSHYAN